MTKFGVRQLLTWGQFRKGNPRWSGECLFMEAERIAWKLEKEIAVQSPDHEINWNDVEFELRLRYTIPDEEVGGRQHQSEGSEIT